MKKLIWIAALFPVLVLADASPVYVGGQRSYTTAKELPACSPGQAHLYNTLAKVWQCVTPSGGVATSLSCSGCVTDSHLASNYSGTGFCAEGSFVRGLNDNASPSCAIPSDTRGTYTFGGWAPAEYAGDKQFARYRSRRHGLAATLHFVVADSSGAAGTLGRLEVVEESTGTVICNINVIDCTAPVGTPYDVSCTNDGKDRYVEPDQTYFLRWAPASGCEKHPGGNATFVVDEDAA